MHELYAEILSYIQGATRFKWVAMAVAWSFCILVWAGVSRLPDRYEATARVHVDTQSKLQPLLSGLAIASQVNQQLQLLEKEIFSRPNLMKIARSTDLDLKAKDNKKMDEIIEDLKDSISLSATPKDFLFTITAKNSDPKLAKAIVEALLALFVEQARGKNREDSNSAQRFLDDQIREYEVRLQKAELAKEEFKRKNYNLLPGQNTSPYSQLQGLTAQLAGAKLALDEAQNRRDALTSQINGEEPTFLGLGSEDSRSSPLDARIQVLEQQVDQLTLKYTDGHPEILAAKRSIEELKKEKAKEADDENFVIDNIQSNPVFQQMKISESTASAEVASLQARVKSYQEQVDLLRTQMDRMLKVETEMQNLNRDYELINKNYQALLASRESARLTEKVDKTTDSINFRIVDPPRVPSTPSFPNRILFSTLALFVGLVLGIGVALGMTFLRPTFPNLQNLREVTGLPILGQVSMNWIPDIKQQKWMGFLRFCGAGMLLFLVFVGVLLLEINGLNLSKV
ncbi:MAG: XrtA system polysaccharide chain length determinant [Methylococcales bacterium]